MSIASLNIALSGLKAAQNAINVTSNNISNASTAGYTRKSLPQEADFSGNMQLGVNISAIVRKVDLALIKSMTEQRSSIEGLNVREKFLNRIQAFHGTSESEQSIGASLNKLKEEFIALSAEPQNTLAIENVVNQAIDTASKFNQFSDLILQLRNDTQTQISEAIVEVNTALERIAEINQQVGGLTGAGRSIADLMDQRDLALKTVAENLDVTFFTAENNKIVVMSKAGQVLADENARQLVFNPTTLLPTSYYPGGGSAGIYIDSTSGIELTGTVFGGKIGELVNLRDNTLPQYQAQLDELAQKTAFRLASQDLELFTDATGNVPPNVPPPGAVSYTGFAAQIQVNNSIIADKTLIRSGTGGATVPEGSNVIIRKVIDFAFGKFAGEQAVGSVDISAGTIFAATGMTQTARVIGDINIASLTTLDSDPNITAGSQFTIDIGTGAQTITINAGDTATDLVNNINAALPNTARLNGLGQIVLEANANITVADISLGAAGISALGLNFGVTTAQSPSFTVQAGINNPVTITIDPTDTAANLLAALNAVPDITASLGASGELIISPQNGGDITLTNSFGNPISDLGLTIQGIAHTAFRENNLGTNANISTSLTSFTDIVGYGQAMVSYQSEEHATTKVKMDSEIIFFNSMEQRFLNESGVDLDQEVANLIQLQTAYSAAARAITVSENMFQTLLDSIK